MATKLSKEAEEAKVFEMMGRIISEWRFLEDNLEAVFDALLDSPHRNLPSAVYYTINSFPVRVKIIDTLIKFRFSPDDKSAKKPRRLTEWANIRKRLKPLESLRNTVAHSLVYTFNSRPGRRTRIRPSIFDGSLAVRYDPKVHPTLYLNDLTRILRRIERTWKAIESFWSRLPEYRGRR
jgi:hypothetical protein